MNNVRTLRTSTLCPPPLPMGLHTPVRPRSYDTATKPLTLRHQRLREQLLDWNAVQLAPRNSDPEHSISDCTDVQVIRDIPWVQVIDLTGDG